MGNSGEHLIAVMSLFGKYFLRGLRHLIHAHTFETLS